MILPTSASGTPLSPLADGATSASDMPRHTRVERPPAVGRGRARRQTYGRCLGPMCALAPAWRPPTAPALPTAQSLHPPPPLERRRHRRLRPRHRAARPSRRESSRPPPETCRASTRALSRPSWASRLQRRPSASCAGRRRSRCRARGKASTRRRPTARRARRTRATTSWAASRAGGSAPATRGAATRQRTRAAATPKIA